MSLSTGSQSLALVLEHGSQCLALSAGSQRLALGAGSQRWLLELRQGNQGSPAREEVRRHGQLVYHNYPDGAGGQPAMPERCL